jgi:branched-chain amino acid transport system substrate-binding protein
LNRLRCLSLACLFGLVGSAVDAQSLGKYDPGASDTEIKIGETAPYSGPLSSASEIYLTEAAYIRMLNETGGINGRKVTLISLDDSYSPPKTVEQTRRLVEQDEVLAVFDQFGTPTAGAAQKYLNAKKIPQLFCASGAARFSDPSFPWSSAMLPSNLEEGGTLGKYVADGIKVAKVAILYQNDDFGKDYVRGFKEATRSTPSVEIVKELTYEPSDPTIDSQINALAASGANVFLNITTGRATAQSIRAIANTQWRPVHLLNGRWADIGAIFKPVGMEKAVGIISAQYYKSPEDPSWNEDPGMNEYKVFMNKYRPGADPYSGKNLSGYFSGQLLAYILREAGSNLTRENINNISMNLKDLEFGVFLPSIRINTSPSRRFLIRDQILTRFDGEKFVPLQ